MDFQDFMLKHKINLNEQQQAAVQKTEGQTLLLAVPGSGKTTVIVARLGYMILQKKINPKHILTMTYNVSAAQDMKSRFISKFGDFEVEFRTINGFCAMVIYHYERIKNSKAFKLMQEHEFSKIIKSLYINMTSEFPSEATIKEVKTKLNYSRNMMLKKEEIKKIKIGKLDFYQFYEKYKNYKLQNKIMDYDDQMEFALKILLNNPNILDYYQNRYPYINVDEAQDTSKIQHIIIRLLASKYKNIFMVGDEDQSIYGFRASYPQALLEFTNIYPKASLLLMEKNYRSTKEIVHHANLFIKLNKNRHDKNMITDNIDKPSIKHTILKDLNRQYKYILDIAKESNTQIALLYRNNDSAIPLIDLFDKNNINYKIKEIDSLFFSNPTILDIINIINFSFDFSNYEIFEQIYYKLNIIIKKSILEEAIHIFKNIKSKSILDCLLLTNEIESWQKRKVINLKQELTKIKHLKSYMAIKYITETMGYSEYMRANGKDEGKVYTILALANQNPELNIFINRLPILESIIKNGQNNNDSNFIMSTIHSSKGLEYDKVLLIDLKDGIFPSIIEGPSGTSELSQEDADLLEEERRLFYVAVTRAKNELEIISYKQSYGKDTELSTFIKQFLQISNQNKVTPPKENKFYKKNNNFNVINKDLVNYKIGTRIQHKIYGEGTIKSIDGHICEVQLDENKKIRSFDLNLCLNQKIIKSSDIT